MTPEIIFDAKVLETTYIDKRTGKRYWVMLGPFGYRMGYVELGKKTPFRLFDDNFMSYLFKLNYDKADNIVVFTSRLREKRIDEPKEITVHGGVTFIDDLVIDKEGKTVRAVGFDCAHYCDKPDKKALEEYFGKTDRLNILVSRLGREHGHLWTHEEVKAECEHLLSQVKAIEDKYNRNKRIESRKQWRKLDNKKWNKRHK